MAATMSLFGAFSPAGFRLGLLVAAFWFGFRHGIDWDHIAAITDITSSQEDRRQAILFGTLYALGHALVVLTLGILAIVVGENLPAGVDNVMTRIVGVTLLLLGVYVFASLIRHGRDFRLRSRWMLVFAGARRAARWVRQRAAERANGTEQRRAGEVAVAEEVEAPSWHHGHSRPEPDDTFMNYGRGTAFGVGMIHGIGAETPTQVLIFLSAAGAGGASAGIIVLVAFIVGLLSSNSLITFGSAMGYLS